MGYYSWYPIMIEQIDSEKKKKKFNNDRGSSVREGLCVGIKFDDAKKMRQIH
jgi:hypothetical protein